MKKKSSKWFFRILLVLFIIFAGLMLILETGYYEAKKRETVVLNEKAIKDFELKIKNNEEIDLNSYLTVEKKNYNNKVSDFGEDLTNGIEKVLTKGMDTIGTVLKTLF